MPGTKINTYMTCSHMRDPELQKNLSIWLHTGPASIMVPAVSGMCDQLCHIQQSPMKQSKEKCNCHLWIKGCWRTKELHAMSSTSYLGHNSLQQRKPEKDPQLGKMQLVEVLEKVWWVELQIWQSPHHHENQSGHVLIQAVRPRAGQWEKEVNCGEKNSHWQLSSCCRAKHVIMT